MLNKVKNSVSGFFKDKKKLTRLYMIVMTVCIMCTMLAVGASAADDGSGGLENVGTVASFLWDQIGNVVSTIVSTPLLLIPVAVFVVGVVISFAKRFIGR